MMLQQRITTVSLAVGLLMAAGGAMAETDLRFSGKAEAGITGYTNDALNCWNDGNHANCTSRPVRVTGENFLRVDGQTEVNDATTIVFRGQTSVYLNSAFYTQSNASQKGGGVKPYYGTAPATYAELEDTWVGVRHDNLGTLRLGKGVNPRMQALNGEFTTDLGGREMLDAMVAYDSPYILGDKGNGLRTTLAGYKGTHMRKEIRIAPEEGENTKPLGAVMLLDGSVGGWLDIRTAWYSEKIPARAWWGDGSLDGVYTDPNALVPSVSDSGAKTHAHGGSIFLSAEFSNFKLGVVGAINQIDKVPMVNPTFIASGYKQQTVNLFGSTWYGPWSLWLSATAAKFTMTADTFKSANDYDYNWLYSNNTRNVMQLQGEISYELTPSVKLYTSAQYQKMDFKEPPSAGGMCQPNGTHACYDPHGSKVSVGLRSQF